KVVTSPYARAELVSIDGSAAKALKGVEAVWQDDALTGLDQNGNGKIQYTGQIVAAVAATSEEIATEAAHLFKVEYKPLDPQVVDNDPALSKDKPSKREAGDVDKAFGEEGVVTVQGEYGCAVIAHCCLEPHGQ